MNIRLTNRFTFVTCHIMAALLSCALFAPQSVLADQEWNVSTGSWFTAANWTPSGVPDASQSAVINNGGQASATAGGPVQALSIDVGQNGGDGTLSTSNVEVVVQGSIDIGDIESIVATGGVNLSSTGSASFSNAGTIEFGLGGMGDINAGQTSASNGSTAMGTGNVTFLDIATIRVSGDFDLGQTSGTAQAMGMGTGMLSNVTDLEIGGDLDVGQTSGGVGGVNSGTGNLTTMNVATLQIGADFDIGQTTGEGQATGSGMVAIADSTLVSVGDSLDIAKVRSFNAGSNIGVGNATIADTDVSIGFGVATPGSIEIARVLITETALGQGTGALTFDQVDVAVANDVIVGELALGGSNSNSFANASLTLIDSRLDTRDLTVASRLDSTAGSVSGTVEIHRSLAIVQSLLSLGPSSTLELGIDGTTRALGDGLETDYSAIDADNASLDGTLSIAQGSAYTGPAGRGQTDTFQLISTLFGIAGSFDTIEVDDVAIGSGPTYVGPSGAGLDGLYASTNQDGTQFNLELYLALPGDANGDRIVDGLDFIIWNDNKFQPGTGWSTGDFNGDGLTDGLDFIIWNDNKFTSAPDAVPEPVSVTWLGALLAASALRRHHR